MSETILDFCTVCGTPSAVHVPGGLFCLQGQLAAEKAMRHDAMAAYAKLEADWRAEKAMREAAERELADYKQFASYCRCCALSGENCPDDFKRFQLRKRLEQEGGGDVQN